MSSRFEITGTTKYESQFYQIKTGWDPTGKLEESKPEHYLVFNKETGVIEFEHEVLPFVLEWMSHFTKRLQDIADGKVPTDDEISGIVRSVN